MLRFLFPRLTPVPQRGAPLFAAITAKAREPHWFVEGGVPDSLDGRFRVLSTLAALAILRLEQFGDAGEAESVALTERFIEVMESEHRELGLGDPALGRTVRKLVGSLARRVEIWRGAAESNAATKDSIYRDEIAPAALEHTTTELRAFRNGLLEIELDAIMEGRLG